MIIRAEEQVVVMLYLQNINQLWHRQMVRYLEDAYAMGNDIYPNSLPDAYVFWTIGRHGTVFGENLLEGWKDLQ